MLLMIDNYDSFTYNLVQYFGELGQDVRVFRNDEITIEGIAALRPDRLVLSPGPCSPAEAGICVEAIRHFTGKLPLLGVCLGHQAIGAALGGQVVRAMPTRFRYPCPWSLAGPARQDRWGFRRRVGAGDGSGRWLAPTPTEERCGGCGLGEHGRIMSCGWRASRARAARACQPRGADPPVRRASSSPSGSKASAPMRLRRRSTNTSAARPPSSSAAGPYHSTQVVGLTGGR